MNGEIIKSKRCHFDRKSTGDPSTLEICPDLEYSVSSKERSKKKKKRQILGSNLHHSNQLIDMGPGPRGLVTHNSSFLLGILVASGNRLID